jgi:copper transport protein
VAARLARRTRRSRAIRDVELKTGMRRLLVVASAACLLVLLSGQAASAHALLRTSDPSSGELLEKSPPKVVITFTEPPDPKLSFIHVLDQSGRDVESGKTQPVPGSPLELQVALPSLSNGVYTVVWRTVSKTDGHVTGNSYAFGVGVAPPTGQRSTTGTSASTPPPSVLAAMGRWGLYWGLALLLAGAVVGLLAFRGRLPGPSWVLVVAWVVAAAGLVAMTVEERDMVGVSYGDLFGSSAGWALVRQGIALLVVGVGVVLVAVSRRTAALVLLALAASAAMLVHAMAGHAASESPTWFNVGVQWMHLLAVGVWVGGLVWLLIGTRRRAASQSQPGVAVSRFSFLAGIALAVVAVTGIARAVDELGGIGAWRALYRTTFGLTLLLKVAVFAGLVALGARNRYVNVAAVAARGERFRSLKRTVGAEVLLAAGIFGITGVLTQLPPAVQLAAAEGPTRPGQLVVTGSDFATSVRVRLTVTPGTVGPNRFYARIADFDSGSPVRADRVSLQFSLPSQPDLGTPSLDLAQGAVGEWTGTGTTLSFPGTWDVSVLIQRPAGSLVVPLQVEPRSPPQTITVSSAPGQPTLYTIHLSGGTTAQTYVDPGKPGNDTVHFTFFQPSGSEQPIASATATATTPAGKTEDLTLIRFDPGHFAANTRLVSGRWRFTIQATTKEGAVLSAYFDQTIGQ